MIWYADYHEADEGDNESTHYDDHGVGSKIDYTFANAGSYVRVSGNAVDSQGWSDHWHYYGTFAGR